MTYSASDFSDDVQAFMVEHGLVRESDLPADAAKRQFTIVLGALRNLVAAKDAAKSLCEKLSNIPLDDEAATALTGLQSAIANIRPPAYMVCGGYGHCFVGSINVNTRWVMCLGTGELLYAEYLGATGWTELSRLEADDLLEDLDSNSVRSDPDEFGAAFSHGLPSWVAAS